MDMAAATTGSLPQVRTEANLCELLHAPHGASCFYDNLQCLHKPEFGQSLPYYVSFRAHFDFTVYRDLNDSLYTDRMSAGEHSRTDSDTAHKVVGYGDSSPPFWKGTSRRKS